MARRSERIRAVMAMLIAIAVSVTGLVAATSKAASQGGGPYTCTVMNECATCSLTNQSSSCSMESGYMCMTWQGSQCVCARFTCMCRCGGSVDLAACYQPLNCAAGGSDPCLDPEAECLPEEQ